MEIKCVTDWSENMRHIGQTVRVRLLADNAIVSATITSLTKSGGVNRVRVLDGKRPGELLTSKFFRMVTNER